MHTDEIMDLETEEERQTVIIGFWQEKKWVFVSTIAKKATNEIKTGWPVYVSLFLEESLYYGKGKLFQLIC